VEDDQVAFATFRAACERWPGTPITLRQGARVIAFAIWRPGPGGKKLVDRLNTKAEVEDGKSVARSAQPNRGPR